MMRDYDIQRGVASISALSAFTPFMIYKLGTGMLLCMNFIQNMFGKFKKEMHSCESWSEQNSTNNYMKRLFFGALMH